MHLQKKELKEEYCKTKKVELNQTIKLNELWDELFDVEIETLKDKLEQKKL